MLQQGFSRRRTGINHAITQKPQNTRMTQQRTPYGPSLLMKPPAAWRNNPQVCIKLERLDPSATTFSLWKDFSAEGDLVHIELFERDGKRDGNGKIRFSPPPKRDFWLTGKGKYLLSRDDGTKYTASIRFEESRPPSLFQSPIRKHIWYRPQLKLTPWSLDFGFMEDEERMMSMRKVTPLPNQPNDMSFVVDLPKLRIVANFKYMFIDPRHRQAVNCLVSESNIGKHDRVNSYMVQILFGQLKAIKKLDYKNEAFFRLQISVDSPPQFYRKRLGPDAGHAPEALVWTEFDTWYRQTDIVYDPFRLPTAKVALHKEQPEIDIGRWTTYLFTIHKASNSQDEYKMIAAALSDFNIEIVNCDDQVNWSPRSAELWNHIDPPSPDTFAAEMESLGDTESSMYLPFEVRYQLEVCISREYLNEYNITKEFVQTLAERARQNSEKARSLLEWVAEHGKRIYDPMTIFQNQEAEVYSPTTEIPHYCAHVRKATITPSTVYFSSPTVETTNRVLRHFARENLDGRFLRVQFTDEEFEGRINSCAKQNKNDELFTRVYRTLYNGIQIGDRHYKFLAFGNSQFRENGAYFFCQTGDLTCESIRDWMGNFHHIKVVAKYAARLGQCFSTTRAINGLSNPTIVKIDDITRTDSNGTEYTFTDGVGKISSFMAKMIAEELGIPGNTPPSAFQFRLGGCKGIVVVSSDAKDKEIHIRPSQQKFSAMYNGLEIIRCARFSCATLNRQTITILSALGVPDEVFLNMLSEQLANYQTAMDDQSLAVDLLCRYIDDSQMTITIATMIQNGFMSQRDPFVMSLLHLWRAWSIKLLKEKAKIIVEDGAFVLGCVDETATLKGYTRPSVKPGEDFPIDELPQIFIQVPDKKDPNKYNVIEGICLVGRNPSLHPGDLRVVQAINVPALHHLRDVVVFPQNGERDIPSMCSGGDLDGDDFFVLWDKGLQPPEWNCEPMNYSPPKPKERKGQVKITDLMKFFVVFMKNDALPTIALAHLAQADILPDSVKDARCLELANLHSKAVDYVKSGQAAEMPKRLRPRRWPHFIESRHRKKEHIYTSIKILGQLYDRVESVNFVPQWEEKFDPRILKAYKLEDNILKTARQVKSQYDTAMRRILANQDVGTEFEIWTTFLLSKPRVGSDYKFQEEICRISDALKAQFRAVCIEKAGGKEFATLGPFVAAMYKVTREELEIALAECRSTKIVGGREVPKRRMEPKSMPLISFPWLFEKELGRIAVGVDASATIDELGFLSLGYRGEGASRRRQGGGNAAMDDYVQQEDGIIIHRGEELDLFRDIDSISDGNDFDDSRSMASEGRYTLGDINSSQTLDEDDLINFSGTGVEDVVAPTKLDGLLNPESPPVPGPKKPQTPPKPLNGYNSSYFGTDKSSQSIKSLVASVDFVANAVSASEVKGEEVVSEENELEAEEEEEEEITLPIRESALERLARMTGS